MADLDFWSLTRQTEDRGVGSVVAKWWRNAADWSQRFPFVERDGRQAVRRPQPGARLAWPLPAHIFPFSHQTHHNLLLQHFLQRKVITSGFWGKYKDKSSADYYPRLAGLMRITKSEDNQCWEANHQCDIELKMTLHMNSHIWPLYGCHKTSACWSPATTSYSEKLASLCLVSSCIISKNWHQLSSIDRPNFSPSLFNFLWLSNWLTIISRSSSNLTWNISTYSTYIPP